MASLNPNGQSPLAPVICYAAANTNQIQNSTWKCQLRFPNRCNHGFGLGLMASITCCASAIRACANSVSLGATCATARIDPPVNFHGLRHTYASRLSMRGVPLAVIAAQLGHAGTRMAERHHSRLAPSYGRRHRVNSVSTSPRPCCRSAAPVNSPSRRSQPPALGSAAPQNCRISPDSERNAANRARQ